MRFVFYVMYFFAACFLAFFIGPVLGDIARLTNKVSPVTLWVVSVLLIYLVFPPSNFYED